MSSIMEHIPNEIWLQIFYWLPLSSLLSVMLTSRRFYELADDNSIWRNLIAQWMNIGLTCKPWYPKLRFKHSILPRWRKFLMDIRHEDLLYIHDNKIVIGTKCHNCHVYHNYHRQIIDLPNYIPNTWNNMYINLCAAYEPNMANANPAYEWKNGKHIEFGYKPPVEDKPFVENKSYIPYRSLLNADFDGDPFYGLLLPSLDFQSLNRGLTMQRRENSEEMLQAYFNVLVKSFNETFISIRKKRYRGYLNSGGNTIGSSVNVSVGYVSKNVPTPKSQRKTNNKKYVTKRQNSPTNLKRMNQVVQKRFNKKIR